MQGNNPKFPMSSADMIGTISYDRGESLLVLAGLKPYAWARYPM